MNERVDVCGSKSVVNGEGMHRKIEDYLLVGRGSIFLVWNSRMEQTRTFVRSAPTSYFMLTFNLPLLLTSTPSTLGT